MHSKQRMWTHAKRTQMLFLDTEELEDGNKTLEDYRECVYRQKNKVLCLRAMPSSLISSSSFTQRPRNGQKNHVTVQIEKSSKTSWDEMSKTQTTCLHVKSDLKPLGQLWNTTATTNTMDQLLCFSFCTFWHIVYCVSVCVNAWLYLPAKAGNTCLSVFACDISSQSIHVCHIYIYIHTYIHTYIYIYIYRFIGRYLSFLTEGTCVLYLSLFWNTCPASVSFLNTCPVSVSFFEHMSCICLFWKHVLHMSLFLNTCPASVSLFEHMSCICLFFFKDMSCICLFFGTHVLHMSLFLNTCPASVFFWRHVLYLSLFFKDMTCICLFFGRHVLRLSLLKTCPASVCLVCLRTYTYTHKSCRSPQWFDIMA